MQYSRISYTQLPAKIDGVLDFGNEKLLLIHGRQYFDRIFSSYLLHKGIITKTKLPEQYIPLSVVDGEWIISGNANNSEICMVNLQGGKEWSLNFKDHQVYSRTLSEIYLYSYKSEEIKVINKDGSIVREYYYPLSNYGLAATEYAIIATNTTEDQIYLIDKNSGGYVSLVDALDCQPAQSLFYYPETIMIDSNSNIWVKNENLPSVITIVDNKLHNYYFLDLSVMCSPQGQCDAYVFAKQESMIIINNTHCAAIQYDYQIDKWSPICPA